MNTYSRRLVDVKPKSWGTVRHQMRKITCLPSTKSTQSTSCFVSLKGEAFETRHAHSKSVVRIQLWLFVRMYVKRDVLKGETSTLNNKESSREDMIEHENLSGSYRWTKSKQYEQQDVDGPNICSSPRSNRWRCSAETHNHTTSQQFLISITRFNASFHLFRM